jgi:membrane associated rhomboid family serine protease
VIPVGDVIPTRTRPVATIAIAAVTLATAVVVRLLPETVAGNLIAATGLETGRFSLLRALVAPFVHADWLSLAANLLVLGLFGRTLEDRLGHDRFVALYVLGALAGAVVVSVASPDWMRVVVGAGAGAGALAGAYSALLPRSRVLMLIWLPFEFDAVELPAIILLGIWCVVQVMAAADGIAAPGTGDVPALWSALSGLVFGAGAVHLLARRERQRVEWWS